MNDTEKSKYPQTIKELEAFIDSYQNKLVHHAFYKLGSREEAEDVVQEVIIKMYKERTKYSDIESPHSFVFRMVSNACIDKLRIRKNTEIKNEQYLNDISCNYMEDSSTRMIEKEEYKRVNEMLSKVPEEQAEVIHQRVIDGMSFVEIARVLEVSTTTVKSRFKYGINKLKNMYQNLKEVKSEL